MYFVTICTWRRLQAFGRVVRGKMVLFPAGVIVRECWLAIPHHSSRVTLGEMGVMPNHVHGIVILGPRHGRGAVAGDPGLVTKGATHASPLPVRVQTPSWCNPWDIPRRGGRGPAPGSLGAIVAAFKSAATRRVNLMRGTAGAPLWQRGFHDRIIPGPLAMRRAERYIRMNPARWASDRQNQKRQERR